MELNFKLTYDIPEELIKALDLTNDTLFSAYYRNGRLYIETVDENETPEPEGLNEDDGEEYTEDYQYGYRDGYHAAMHGEETPDQLFGECEISDDCGKCPYYCHSCGACNVDWEGEDDE